MLLENEGVRCQVSAIKNYKSQNTNIKQITMTEIQNSKIKETLAACRGISSNAKEILSQQAE